MMSNILFELYWTTFYSSLYSPYLTCSLIGFSLDLCKHLCDSCVTTNMSWGSCGLMVRVWLLIKRFRVRVSGRQELYSALYTLNTKTEVPLSKSPNPQLLPGLRRINGCPLLRVCVHGVCGHCCVCPLWMGKCRAQILSMGHHTWPYVTSISHWV